MKGDLMWSCLTDWMDLVWCIKPIVFTCHVMEILAKQLELCVCSFSLFLSPLVPLGTNKIIILLLYIFSAHSVEIMMLFSFLSLSSWLAPSPSYPPCSFPNVKILVKSGVHEKDEFNIAYIIAQISYLLPVVVLPFYSMPHFISWLLHQGGSQGKAKLSETERLHSTVSETLSLN